jgi:hypothetical protein
MVEALGVEAMFGEEVAQLHGKAILSRAACAACVEWRA